MATKRKEQFRGSQVKNVRKRCWQTPSRSMGGRNGHVIGVPSPMCGRGGAAGDATTSRQDLLGIKELLPQVEQLREERQDKKDRVTLQEENVVLRKTGI